MGNDQAKMAEEREKQEIIRRRQAVTDRIAAEQRTADEKAKTEEAELRAREETRISEYEREAKRQAEMKAEEEMKRRRNAEEQANEDVAKAHEMTLKEKNKKYQEMRKRKEAEDRCEETVKILNRMKKDTEVKDEERQKLLSEKQEAKRIEAEQKAFKWGPKSELPWNQKVMSSIRYMILKRQTDSNKRPISLKVLVFGPSGHGKSSFCNSCRSSIKGKKTPSTFHHVGSGTGGSITRGFHGALYGQHWIIDMPGLYESNRILSVNIEDIASGRVPFYAEVTDTLEIKNKDNCEIPAPGENDVSCVVIVLKYDADMTTELKRQIEVIHGLCGKGVISCHLVLTHLDVCDPQFCDTDNIPNLYDSPSVQGAIKRMSEEAGLPPLAISMVKNYTRETETDINSTLLHLRVLEKIVNSSLEQVEKQLNTKRQRDMYCEPKRFAFDSLSFTLNEIQFIMIALLMAVAILYFSRDSLPSFSSRPLQSAHQNQLE